MGPRGMVDNYLIDDVGNVKREIEREKFGMAACLVLQFCKTGRYSSWRKMKENKVKYYK